MGRNCGPEMTGTQGKISDMTANADRRYLGPAEAAKELGLSKSSIYRAVHDGSLRAVQLRPHGKLHIPSAEIEPRRRCLSSGFIHPIHPTGVGRRSRSHRHSAASPSDLKGRE
jgi:excisionase family DNA binding protein